MHQGERPKNRKREGEAPTSANKEAKHVRQPGAASPIGKHQIPIRLPILHT